MDYITVQKPATDFFIEKKSKFIGHCAPVQTEEEALTFISRIKKEHWDASHNVYAYSLREGSLIRFSDDGEPQGTAGIPVVEVLKKSGVVDAAVVATRYFGGTLLGGGGLIRAYSHTASIAVAAAGKIIMRECVLMTATCDYHQYGKVSAVIPECGGVIDDTEFLADVNIHFHMAPGGTAALDKKLADATNGRVRAVREGRRFFAFEMDSDSLIGPV